MNECVFTEAAPAPVGPYSQAIRRGGLLFISGQIPMDPADGSVETGEAAAQARLVLENLKAVAAAGGAGLADIVKTTIYLTDMDDFGAVNGVYAEYFTDAPPARACVAVAGLPKGVAVEIEAVAVVAG